MADAWVKNLGNRISAAEKLIRNRERKLLGFESEEQKIDSDMKEMNKRKQEVIEKAVEVYMHREELMRKMEKLQLEKVALQMEMEELDKKGGALLIRKNNIATEKVVIEDVKEKESKRVEKLIRQKKELEDAVKFRLEARDRQAEQEAQEMKQFLRETIARKELSLECPVCTELAEAPIYCCSEQHLICKNCKGHVDRCPICREIYGCQGARRHRGAEKVVEEIKELGIRLGR